MVCLFVKTAKCSTPSRTPRLLLITCESAFPRHTYVWRLLCHFYFTPWHRGLYIRWFCWVFVDLCGGTCVVLFAVAVPFLISKMLRIFDEAQLTDEPETGVFNQHHVESRTLWCGVYAWLDNVTVDVKIIISMQHVDHGRQYIDIDGQQQVHRGVVSGRRGAVSCSASSSGPCPSILL
jgi:hypothetical protein